MERLLENGPQDGGLLEQSVRDANRSMDFSARKCHQQTIAQIDAGLARLNDGSFGYCLETGEEIGLKHLLAYPIATLSVETQELRERRDRIRIVAGHQD